MVEQLGEGDDPFSLIQHSILQLVALIVKGGCNQLQGAVLFGILDLQFQQVDRIIDVRGEAFRVQVEGKK